MKHSLPIFLFSLTPLLAAGQESAATSELILAELQKMSATIERLEKRIDTMEEQVSTITGVASGAVPNGVSAGASDATLMERVVEAVHVREQRINFPWMELSLWNKLEKGMTSREVMDILGDPTLEDPSLHKKVDIVYTYRGRRPADGALLTGKIKFRKGKVVVIEAP